MKTVLMLTLLAAIAIYLLTQTNIVTEEVAQYVSPDIEGVPTPENVSNPDKVKALAVAIATAEGFFNPVEIGKFIQNRPQRNHNPGDITDNTQRVSGKDSGGLNIYQNDNDGWQDLFEKIDRMLSGNSHTFPLSYNFDQLAQTYTGGDNPTSWRSNVLKALDSLGISMNPSNTMQDYVNA